VSPATYTDDELFGPVHAFERPAADAPHTLQRKSVFEMVLDNYQREIFDLKTKEVNRLIQAFFIDSTEINQDLSDCLTKFLQEANARERDYQKETEFMLDFSKDATKIHQGLVQRVAVRFPNGNVTLFPSDIFFFFECQSIENCSPAFLSSVGIVNTQEADVLQFNLFYRQLKLVEQKHADFIKNHRVKFDFVRECAKDFVIPFIQKLDQQPMVASWSLWNTKAITMQFFVVFNAFFHRLAENCELNKYNDDPMDYPFREMMRDVLWNLMLVAMTWSFGAVLNRELRRMFDE